MSRFVLTVVCLHLAQSLARMTYTYAVRTSKKSGSRDTSVGLVMAKKSQLC